ncbi:hypothetical protein H9X57_05225 [Flavobacterium piscinae]|uniref:HYR-like domain-containing protein n=1 Tax=Flavobacterium piscinae TaxID=2506424 RepID=UPI00199E001D|nr:hypothetical protein [Flavobacterium piscinae]MBC8883010.1 hypothetical protein [Flavobacterium piscinae]
MDDNAGPINGTSGQNGVVNVFDNDTLNGNPVNPADVTLTLVTPDPTGALTLNPDGSVDVAVGTPAGTYTLTYQICENLNPGNCDTAVVTITVSAPVIDAVDDNAGPINGTSGQNGVVNVFDNDTLNGNPVNPADVTLTLVTPDPTGALTLNPDGSVDVAVGTPAGTYTLTYQICENLNPGNCDTAVVTITVSAPVIDAVDDNAGPINGTSGQNGVVNVFDNDTLNGNPVNPADVTLTLVTPDPTGALTLNPDGSVDVAVGTPAGTYTLTYQICENLNPGNCDTAVVTITVSAPVIDAVDDNAGPINGTSGQNGVVNVFDNDTLNGNPVNPADVTLTLVTPDPTGALTLNPDGSVDVAVGTPAGTYTLTYQICENLNPGNCDTAVVTITVSAPVIDAVDDNQGPVNGASGQTAVVNVFDNDTLNGNPVNPADVTLTLVTPDPTGALTLNPDGTVDVAAGTPAGTYTLTYQICENLNPGNCDTAVVTIVVSQASIIAQNDNYNAIECITDSIIGNVLNNDSVNNSQASTSNVNFSIISGNYPNISIDTEGNITVSSGIQAGQYTFEYTICEIINPTNCSSAIITVNVIDNTVPVISLLPGESTINCPNTPEFTQPTATDACGDVTLTFNDVITNGNCTGNYSITRTWTATDLSGNITTASQTINVIDTTAPVFVEVLPTDNTVDCSQIPAPAVLTAIDECSSANVVFNEVIEQGNCANQYSLIRTWVATDDCGNSVTHVQTISVEDNVAPTFVEELPNDFDVTIECSQIPMAVTLTATDNCGSATVTYNESIQQGNCTNAYIITRTWTATDVCNNTRTHVQTINVNDTTAPTFVEELPADVTVECTAVPTAATLTATDNCGDATVSFTESTEQGQCANAFVVTRTWTATDACNNQTVHTQIITVQDTTAPTFVEELPADVTVECTAVPTVATLTATDNCGDATVAFNESTEQGQCANAYVVTRTWTATDECGNETTHTQIITVQDTTAPAFVEELPANVTVECSAVPTVATLTATDNCGEATVAFTESTEQGQCANAFVVTRTWTATDECGNETTHIQIITVQDTVLLKSLLKHQVLLLNVMDLETKELLRLG